MGGDVGAHSYLDGRAWWMAALGLPPIGVFPWLYGRNEADLRREVERAFRKQAKRWHPDSALGGNAANFRLMVKAKEEAIRAIEQSRTSRHQASR